MPYCKYCGKEYKLHGIHNHERFCDKNPNKESNEYLKQNEIKTCKILADRKHKEKTNIVKTEYQEIYFSQILPESTASG